ncbi:MAG TPA: adenylate/guanylate cyclase domain-containing protein [Candidatus Methylomirabilis sp.]|nr:adenylate/guanylate cyclase domain-containing protein [Candidatus Methylomirabilis sp.]
MRLYLRLVLVGALIGTGYGGFIGRTFRGTGLIGAAVGATDGAVIAAAIAAVEIFVLGTRWGRTLQRAPFLLIFGVKWFIYGAVITAVNARSPGVLVFGPVLGAGPLGQSLQRLGILFSFAAAFVVLFVFELRLIVGMRTLRHLVLGRYRRPRIEDRFFLFVDVVGSTSLAERIGPAAVHRFLGEVFLLASDPVADFGGEIYQYVGDEMVVTWPLTEGRMDARPIACFFAILAALEAAAPAFERDFGLVPRLRAALHAGTVIGGEIGGVVKRDVIFHGDVMNTAARLEQATRDLDRSFLVSADALNRLTGTERYMFEPLGPRALRGRAAPVEVYAVTLPAMVTAAPAIEAPAP